MHYSRYHYFKVLFLLNPVTMSEIRRRPVGTGKDLPDLEAGLSSSAGSTDHVADNDVTPPNDYLGRLEEDALEDNLQSARQPSNGLGGAQSIVRQPSNGLLEAQQRPSPVRRETSTSANSRGSHLSAASSASSTTYTLKDAGKRLILLNRLAKRGSARAVIRTSNNADLATGERRQCLVEEVDDSLALPMNPRARLRKQVAGNLASVAQLNYIREEEEDEEEEETPKQPKHYRLTNTKSKTKKWFGIPLCWTKKQNLSEKTTDEFAQNNWMSRILHWCFRRSYRILFVATITAFWTCTLLWAIVIYGVARYDPQCLIVLGNNFTAYSGGEAFMDAYAVSWTTFSTVGYGLVYPSISVDEGPRCFGINALMTLEAYVGVLFASFMSAIILSKLSRTQSFADVVFSDPMVVRYGCGVMLGATGIVNTPYNGSKGELGGLPPIVSSKELRLNQSSVSQKIPCPVLEFRLSNRMSHLLGGEIVDASINGMVSLVEDKLSDSIRESLTHPSHTKKKQPENDDGNDAEGVDDDDGSSANSSTSLWKTPLIMNKVTRVVRKSATGATGAIKHAFSATPTIEEQKVFDPDRSAQSTNYASITEATKKYHVVDEGSNLVPCRIFSTLKLEPATHPFFKRSWIVSHTLDASSPILSEEARRAVKKNDGFWPQELNDYQSVRENIRFDQIIVSLSGTSNAAGNVVRAQKVYEFGDLNVGYTFANMLLRDEEGFLITDDRLINDVREQVGGGGEPFREVQGLPTGGVLDIAQNLANKTGGITTQAVDQVKGTVQTVAKLASAGASNHNSRANSNDESVLEEDESTHGKVEVKEEV